jgi:DNA-binding SARP family transcriptional activator
VARWRLQFLGHPQLFDPRGASVEITSRKTIALVALLATADTGIRSRVWLQQKLWGSREARQAQSSLRRELSYLRKAAPGFPLITTYRTVAIDLTHVEMDIAQAGAAEPQSEFLEGLDTRARRISRNGYVRRGAIFDRKRTMRFVERTSPPLRLARNSPSIGRRSGCIPSSETIRV